MLKVWGLLVFVVCGALAPSLVFTAPPTAAAVAAVATVQNVQLAPAPTPAPAPAPSGFDYMQLINMLIPAIWGAVGPLAIAGITKGMNSLGGFIPKPIQVILASVLGAVAGLLANDPSVAASAAVAGTASQVYATTKPSTLLTDK